jgi:hypothetical protein
LSHNGTVRCSWCFRTGHNRASCPERKQFILENPDGHEARRDAQKSRRAQSRKCTYCKEEGHNRRKCSQLKADHHTLQRRLEIERGQIKDFLYSLGLGTGALVCVSEGYWDDSHVVGLVSKIDWRDADNKENVTLIIEKIGGGSTIKRTVDLTKEAHGHRPRAYNCLEVVSPIPEELALSMVPSSWERGHDYSEEKYFPKGERRRAWQWEERL